MLTTSKIQKKLNILVIAGGSSVSAATNQNKLLKLLINFSENIYLITFCDNNQKYLLNNEHIRHLKSFQNRFINFGYNQIAISKALFLLLCKYNFDIVMFVFGQDLEILPVLISKIFGKKVIIRSDGRPTNVLKANFISHSFIKTHIFKAIEEINYRLSDVLLTECEYMIEKSDFTKYSQTCGANLFVDTNKFKNKRALHHRYFHVGYIGRFSDEKGILNFVKALPEILSQNENLNILIAGNGELRNEIEEFLNEISASDRVTFRDWIDHEELPLYLNNLKLLIVPSYIEGLPNMIIEAAACGTLVLATPVGAIPAVIKDEETGFIMDNNSPVCIAENVKRVLNYPDLESIVNKAESSIENEFSYEASVERYLTIFGKI